MSKKKCPICGAEMKIDTSAVCTSIPPKYRCVCPSCNYLDFIKTSEYDQYKEEPSLPSNLDEAAEEYAEDEMMSGLAERAFKAGAEYQYQIDRGEFAKLKAKEWQEGYDDGAKWQAEQGEAARWLGVKPPCVSSALKQRQRHHTVCGFTAEYENPIPPEIKGFVPKRVRKEQKEKEDSGYLGANMNPYKDMQVDIDGVMYRSVPVENKTSCVGCDILKDSSGLYQPFCFDYSCGKHKIVELCRGHQMIWKKQ